MRNDATDDADHLPGLSASRDRDEPVASKPPFPGYQRHALYEPPPRRGAGGALLWVLVVALVISLGGLALWSYRQIALLEMQLVATQDSFARISEAADGRLTDIRGQVVAAESSVTSESEAVKLRIRQLEQQLAALNNEQPVLRSQQRALADQQEGAGRRLDEQLRQLQQVAQAQEAGQADRQALGAKLGELEKAQARLQESVAAQARLGTRLDGLAQEVASLKGTRRDDSAQAIAMIEQDLLVLRSQMENRAASGSSTAEFDAFRAQVTRSINTLQNQIANLQAQIDAR